MPLLNYKALSIKLPDGLGRVVLVLLIAVLVHGCASPAGNLTRYASDQGFTRSKLKTGGYNLTVFDNASSAGRYSQSDDGTLPDPNDPLVLHVYLEGDGSPWWHRVIIMPDPTPRSPLMLRLMALDSSLSVYVGRPCYNGASNEPDCHNGLWTSGRYSPTVVQSMASAIRVLAREHKPDELWLFGHSGGGALAMLLAPEIEQVTRVVTIAGNLDTDAWTEHHSYSRLYSSGNPAKLPPLRTSIEQWHFLGQRDRVIPPALVQDAIARQESARTFVLPGFSHGCCWAKIWPAILDALAANDPRKVPGNVFSSEARSTFFSDSQ